jgi:hypothetical protein
MGGAGSGWFASAGHVPHVTELVSGMRYALEVMNTINQKFARQPKGQGKSVPLKKDELNAVLNAGKYGLISAGPNTKETDAGAKDKSKDEQYFRDRHDQLRSSLNEMGYQYTEVVGKYGEIEDSFLIMTHETDKADLMNLGMKYNQDSVIYGEGGKQEMIYTSKSYYEIGEKGDPNYQRIPAKVGDAHVGAGFDTIDLEANNYYTEVPTPEGKVRFSLHYDFEKVQSSNLGDYKSKDYQVSNPVDNRQVT